MRAVVFDDFGGPLTVRDVPEPEPPAHGVVVEVAATGVCRSDWHAWQGHDATVVPPHVPGHELAGRVVAVGAEVTRWHGGERVTVPFVLGCGRCGYCRSGQAQVCPAQTQPGFTRPGSFAERVALDHADTNLVALPDDVPDDAAAALGCRVATAWRAVADRARVRAGEWVGVHGCGGLGLAAVAVAVLHGARVVAVDVAGPALAAARAAGAEVVLDAAAVDVPAAVVDATSGGAHVALDCAGSPATCADAVASLRPRGRHVQVGLLPGGATPVPMDRVVALELDLLGSHGMAATDYPRLLAAVSAGRLRPQDLVARHTDLAGGAQALASMSGPAAGAGITVVRPGGR